MSPTVGSKHRSIFTGESVKVKHVEATRIEVVGEDGARQWVESTDFGVKFRETRKAVSQ